MNLNKHIPKLLATLPVVVPLVFFPGALLYVLWETFQFSDRIAWSIFSVVVAIVLIGFIENLYWAGFPNPHVIIDESGVYDRRSGFAARWDQILSAWVDVDWHLNLEVRTPADHLHKINKWMRARSRPNSRSYPKVFQVDLRFLKVNPSELENYLREYHADLLEYRKPIRWG